ncbi:hypothetical protein [Hymenobacter swuensis]|uniref:Uncharacterized protein n=1 Tax=Hymenobacter swuensis DY53 TaxID=1227739 RepID=W8F3E2_9BACT|nr:hypothetical protein [Hymenobacter swuensis]AHJ98532.1 hypothetical protein Hsw_2937 [Hymenobacter swuensis DY53]
MSATLPLPTAALAALMPVSTWLRVLHRANPVLAWAGWLHVALLLLALVLLTFDHRLVTGLPVWVKPAKFALSGLLYLWTLAWLLADLPAPANGAVRLVSGAAALSMVVEMACIFLQAARGTTSHYNGATAFDGLVFGLMGVFILVNTLATIWAVYLVWHYQPHGPAGYVWGVRLGLLVFLVGSVLGGVMIRLGQHTVGAPDGGPGLPGLGWSTRAGDLRLAHFLGMHALQALPLLGWALSYWQPRHAGLLTWLGTAVYVGAVAALFIQAMRGVPVVKW